MPWIRVSKSRPCGHCGKSDWCTATDDGQWVCCMRASTGFRPRTDKHGEEIGGWYIRIQQGMNRSATTRIEGTREAPKRSPIEIEIIHRQHKSCVQPKRLAHLAKSLGVTADSLRALAIGWDAAAQAWTFPMVDEFHRTTGLRYRRDTGGKWSLTGGSEGIFAPPRATTGPIIICEGPTSAAAWLTLGFDAIGRPSCTGGINILKAIVPSLDRPVLIVADRDSRKKRRDGSFFYPGQDGAKFLHEQLKALCVCTVAICPVSKDARDWIKRGATHATVTQWVSEVSAANPTGALIAKQYRPASIKTVA